MEWRFDTERGVVAGRPVSGELLRETLAPIADFDGDGRPDASDPDPFDPAR